MYHSALERRVHPQSPQCQLPRTKHIDGQRICNQREIRPVAGYIVGSGQFLSKTCLRCYRAAGRESKDRAYQVRGSGKGARS